MSKEEETKVERMENNDTKLSKETSTLTSMGHDVRLGLVFKFIRMISPSRIMASFFSK